MRQKMKKSSKRKREIKLKISFNKKDEGDDYFEEEKGNSQDQDSSNVSQAWMTMTNHAYYKVIY